MWRMFTSLARHTFIVRSWEAEQMRPSPLHRRNETPAVWPAKTRSQRPINTSQIRTSPSLEEEARRRARPSLNTYQRTKDNCWLTETVTNNWAYKCSGSQTRHVIHFLCPTRVDPICCPVDGSQMITLTKETQIRGHWRFAEMTDTPVHSCKRRPIFFHLGTSWCTKPSSYGLQQKCGVQPRITRINYALPLHVNWGVSVLTSQNRTVVSPDPLARYLQRKSN